MENFSLIRNHLIEEFSIFLIPSLGTYGPCIILPSIALLIELMSVITLFALPMPSTFTTTEPTTNSDSSLVPPAPSEHTHTS